MAEAAKDSVRRSKARTDGDGSIYCRHKADCPERGVAKPKCKCPWQGALVIDWKGKKPVRKKVSGPNRNVVANKLRDLRDQVRGDELPPDGKPMTVEQWMSYWFKRVAPRRCKPLTLAGYDAKVNDYIIPLLGHHRLDKLQPEHIEDAWDWLRENGNPTKAEPDPLSPNTIHQTHRILSRALKVAVQRKKLRTNPAGADSMDAPSRQEHEIVPMSEAEVDAVLDTCRGQWNAARWNVALAIGLRQGEALGLRWEDVDLDAGTVTIRQTLMRLTGQGIVFGTPKSEKSRRTIVVPPSLLAGLKAHRIAQTERRLELGNHWTDSGLVFTLDDGRPIDPSVDAARWRRLLTQAGVKHYRLHDARHSAGTMMVSEGVDLRTAMQILGHSQLSVTMRYQHVVDAAMKDAATKLDRKGRWA
jgi:integrase